MATLFGPHGQSVPAANTAVLLYKVPTLKRNTFTVVAANFGVTSTWTVWCVPDGETRADKHLEVPTQVILANEPKNTKALTIRAGVEIWVESSSGNVSFSVYGPEQDE